MAPNGAYGAASSGMAFVPNQRYHLTQYSDAPSNDIVIKCTEGIVVHFWYMDYSEDSKGQNWLTRNTRLNAWELADNDWLIMKDDLARVKAENLEKPIRVILTTQHGEEEFQVKLGDPVMLTVRQLLGCDESKEVAITFGTDAVDSDAETFYDLGAQDGARLSVVEAIAFYQHNWSFQRTRTEYAPEYRQIESGHYTVLHKGIHFTATSPNTCKCGLPAKCLPNCQHVILIG